MAQTNEDRNRLRLKLIYDFFRNRPDLLQMREAFLPLIDHLSFANLTKTETFTSPSIPDYENILTLIYQYLQNAGLEDAAAQLKEETQIQFSEKTQNFDLSDLRLLISLATEPGQNPFGSASDAKHTYTPVCFDFDFLSNRKCNAESYGSLIRKMIANKNERKLFFISLQTLTSSESVFLFLEKELSSNISQMYDFIDDWVKCLDVFVGKKTLLKMQEFLILNPPSQPNILQLVESAMEHTTRPVDVVTTSCLKIPEITIEILNKICQPNFDPFVVSSDFPKISDQILAQQISILQFQKFSLIHPLEFFEFFSTGKAGEKCYNLQVYLDFNQRLYLKFCSMAQFMDSTTKENIKKYASDLLDSFVKHGNIEAAENMFQFIDPTKFNLESTRNYQQNTIKIPCLKIQYNDFKKKYGANVSIGQNLFDSPAVSWDLVQPFAMAVEKFFNLQSQPFQFCEIKQITSAIAKSLSNIQMNGSK